jgi:hypothetical protein
VQVFLQVARELEVLRGPEQRLPRIAALATMVTNRTWAAIAEATDQTPVVAATSDPEIGEQIARLQAAGGGGPPER